MCLFNIAIYVECYSTDQGREAVGEKETDRVKQGAVVFSLKEAVIRVSWSVAQLQMCV